MPLSRTLRFRRTLAFRVSAAVFLSLCVLFVGNYFGNYRALQRSLGSNVRTTIAQTSQLLNTAVSATSNVPGGSLHTLEAFFKEMVNGDGKDGIVYVVVKKENGATLLQAGRIPNDLPMPDSPDQFEACAIRGICHVRDPILLEGNDIGFLQYGLATKSTMEALTQTHTTSLALTTAVTLLIFSAIAVYGLRVARRAARLRRASNEIATGNYSIRVKIDGTDELSDLSENFNRMTDAVEAKIAEISKLKDGLEVRVKERTEELQASNQLLAANMSKLANAREQLVKTEKLAGLGSLVAGVSHELNTPIGNALVAATTVYQRTREFAILVAQDKLSRKALDAFVRGSLEGNELTERSLRRAADLIGNFKKVSVDQASERKRVFDLAQTMQEVATTLNYLIKVTSHNLTVRIAPDISMESYPGPLGQVVTNLISNSLIHAFDNTQNGEMILSAIATPSGRVVMEFRDNGTGVPDQYINRIFDPFFTTRMGQGGSGLGLSVVNNIVESLLGGSIRVESTAGSGTLFVIDIPLVAP